jgi:hypothetical protein
MAKTAGPMMSESISDQNSMEFWRPRVRLPQLPPRPTQLWRPKPRPPWLNVPWSGAKPDSSV